MEQRRIPTSRWEPWYQNELCEAFPPNERKPWRHAVPGGGGAV